MILSNRKFTFTEDLKYFWERVSMKLRVPTVRRMASNSVRGRRQSYSD